MRGEGESCELDVVEDFGWHRSYRIRAVMSSLLIESIIRYLFSFFSPDGVIEFTAWVSFLEHGPALPRLAPLSADGANRLLVGWVSPVIAQAVFPERRVIRSTVSPVPSRPPPL